MRPEPEPPWAAIGNCIESATGLSGRLTQLGGVGGGGINRAVRVEFGGTGFFIKLNDASRMGMFEAEAMGLKELAGSRTLRVPVPVCHGHDNHTAFLVP